MDSNSNPSPDQGQKDAFLNGLSQFLADKGRYLCKAPKLAGKMIDLHDLYNKVTSAGGYQKVTDRAFWEDFLDHYGFTTYSVTLAYGLQKIYQAYLEDYEKIHFFGDDEPQAFSRTYAGYRRFRYPVSDMQRIQNNMNIQKPSLSDYDRVVLSLESCLPNEIDFAVNACTLLSGESRHVLRLPQCRRIVDALLLHAGIVTDGYDSYSGVLEELQKRTNHDFHKFWKTSILKKSVLQLLLTSKEDQEDSDKNSDSDVKEAELTHRKCKSQKVGPNFAHVLKQRLLAVQQSVLEKQQKHSELKRIEESSSKWSELFHGHRSLGVQDYEGQRVLQIALVLLNLSFEDFNVVLLARHASLLRFVFLCIHSQYSCLRQTGLDILSNISSHIQVIHLHYNIAAMIFDTIHSTLQSEDKFERIRGFEILGNICRMQVNADYVCVSACDEVYDATVQNLMVSDVELLLSAIEALYRLSKLGETTCTKIIFVKGCIDLLMCLLTLNVRSFGPEKLSEIRLARRISSAQHQQQQQPGFSVPIQPQAINHAHVGVMKQMQYQNLKQGSVHQAQPTIATVATTIPHIHSTHKPPNLKPPVPPPSVPPPPVPVITAEMTAQLKQDAVQQQPATPNPLMNSPQKGSNQPVPQETPPRVCATVADTPPSGKAVSVTSQSPPGAGPIYTHSEAGTIPPVFHYMPAPPPEIVQDNSPDSFTKLWIWATYEFESESYIPRVDVYCEYLASSNRYGRQGKTEVLSATDFGKCLKQIFPQASSRLFNQGRGQPQYHIAGIKIRATPLPVPGYQLKDPVSVFSSEYEKIPTSVVRTVTNVVSNNQQKNTTTVGSNQISVAPSSNIKIASSPEPAATSLPIQDLQFQPILVVPVTLSTQPLAPDKMSVAQPSFPPVPPSNLVSSEKQTGVTEQDAATATSSNPVSEQGEQATVAMETETTVNENSGTCLQGRGNELNTTTAGGLTVQTVAPGNGETNINCRKNDLTPILVNGFPDELHNKSRKPREDEDDDGVDSTSGKCAKIGHDNCEEILNTARLKQKVKNASEQPLMNGFDESAEFKAESEIQSKQINGINGNDSYKSVVHKENSSSLNGEAKSLTVPISLSSSVTCENSVSHIGNVTPCTQVVTLASHVTTPVTQAPTTPTNALPHAELNRRLKDTITKRKNSQITPSSRCIANSPAAITTPVNTTLPPPVDQQYSYGQQAKSIMEEPKESRGVVLAQHIIPITPQQLQQQYVMQRQHTPGDMVQQGSFLSHQTHATSSSQSSNTQLLLQAGTKRPHPQTVNNANVPPAKIFRLEQGTTAVPQVPANPIPTVPGYVSSTRQSPFPPQSYTPGQVPGQKPHMTQSTPRPPLPHPHRPPYQGQPRAQHPVPNPHIPNTGGQQKPKQPTIDLMAPNASLLVLYRNVGKIPFANHLDEKEDAISKSVRLTASLILTNIARYSDLGRSFLQQHEGHLASIAMSQMDCSPIVARLLSEMEL